MSEDILNAKELYERTSEAIVTILSKEGNYTSTSTGFIIKHTQKNEGLYIATVAHAVFTGLGNRDKHVDDIYAVIYNYNNTGINEFKKCKVIGLAGYADFAILSVDNLEIDKNKYVEWSDNKTYAGDKCYVIGNPVGIEISAIVEGIVRNPSFTYRNNIEIMSFTAPTLKGNSGSPVFNDCGKVSSIVSNGMPGGDNFNYGAKSNLLRFLSNYIINNKTDFVGGTINRDLFPVDISYMYHMKPSFNGVKGYCVGTDLEDQTFNHFDVILSIDGKTIGAHSNYKKPTSIYLSPGKTIKLEHYCHKNKTIKTIDFTINKLTKDEDIYRHH
tara:strand:- start:7320 stop:8303 length:984 start_codon:yes stop_codon:yes gene_type:complete